MRPVPPRPALSLGRHDRLIGLIFSPAGETRLATVSLDGIHIEVAHGWEPTQLAQRMQEFARDLAENRFADWGLQVAATGESALSLRGARDGTRFEADIAAHPGRVEVTLRGLIELAWVKLTLAGGSDGVRRRVHDEIHRALSTHLA